MKLPRDLPGNEVAMLLTRHYGYRVARTRGSHMTVTLAINGNRHNVKEAVDCYFDHTMKRPKLIRLHFVREEVLHA